MQLSIFLEFLVEVIGAGLELIQTRTRPFLINGLLFFSLLARPAREILIKFSVSWGRWHISLLASARPL